MSNGSVLITQPITAKSAAKPVPARTRLLLEGPIISTLLRLAAPNVVVNVVLIAVTATVDAHFVGQMGSDALAGLSLVFPLIMLMQQMANSSMGGSHPRSHAPSASAAMTTHPRLSFTASLSAPEWPSSSRRFC
jgi:hypothetical protein